jgi:SnoaL-like domain
MTTADNSIVIDTRTGQRGSLADWVECFKFVWAAPRERLDPLMALLNDSVTLKAPTRPPVTRGQAAGRRAFERVLRVAPDLHAEVIRWAGASDTLFIEMTFHATLAGRLVSWNSVDRFLFQNGEAVERIAYFADSNVVWRAAMRRPSGWIQLARLIFGR